MSSETSHGLQNRRRFVKVAAATLATSAFAALTTGASHAAGRHSDPEYCAPLCLHRGSRIATITGETAIENLQKGDLVRTEDGRFFPVLSIRHERFTKAPDAAWSRNVEPVLIKRSAISENTPSRDIYVSPKHGIYLDGYFIQAECLVNDVTIRQKSFIGDVIDYYHVELDEHHVMYAEGLALESMLSYSPESLTRLAALETVVSTERQPYAPILGYDGGRRAMVGLLRHAASAFVDVRDPIQIVYDRLAERALLLAERGCISV